MSLKAELETWVDALNAYDAQDFDKALDLFGRIADSSKILTNIGLIHATLGEHELAVENFNAATGLDQFLAVAYFQCGVSNFLMGRYDLSYKDFEEAYLYLRGNESIKYQQLGLQFTLYSTEVLFNRGLAQMYLNRIDEGLADMRAAQKEKVTPEHDVIDECIRDQGEGYTVFSIPVGVLYRPPESKVKNSKAKDYLGKAKLVAASDSQNMFTGFAGAELLARGQAPSGAKLDNARPRDDGARPAAAALPKPPADVPPPKLNRAPTQIRPAQPSEAARAGGRDSPAGGAPLQRGPSIAALTPTPTRGLSVRRPPGGGDAPPPPRKDPPPQQPATRLTEIYDDYIGFSDEPAPPLPPPVDQNRVANWASKVQPNPPPSSFPGSRAGSVRASPSMRRKPSSAGNMRRGPGSMRSGSGRMGSVAYDDEEGYGSGGEYEESQYYELSKILVKLHYRDDTRGMAVAPDMPYDEFLERVTSKFGRSLGGLSIRFKDEDGARISLKDEMDFELAIETARENAKGKPEGKLEVWCEDA
ncbi:hypothetical protein EXIGLDRAFT_733284 [Exidia glandulosa HHB12029]|uniref:PB1 domain-containing protein n=1 Tax=Exidia glandulosa HHB12029 TaxID=1314781 RepID=A0A165BBS5_EXIGL|nr:hypothetical protein EXIGLDRAFT_733284 [Exidia glandulosa HHB12029]